MLNRATVGIIGAGTMGTGIALAASAGGHRVVLHDAFPAARTRASEAIATHFERQCARSGMTGEEARRQSALIELASDMDAFAGCGIVIEAVSEEETLKAAILSEVEGLLAEDAILATNTSSLSITRLAQPLRRPARFLGMHFFNPAQVMPLVEVVSGHRTSPEVRDAVCALARRWGKVPVQCRSAPGFIVNKVARPYYGEAWRLLEQKAASAATIDLILEEAGGFRMGPFTLMDLIGHDVNLSVTRSLFAQTSFDPRYRPSLLQQDLVDAGLLGRKSGHGIYDHSGGAPERAAEELGPGPTPRRVAIGRLSPRLAPLADLIAQAGLDIETHPSLHDALEVDGTLVAPSDGRTAAELAAALGRPIALFDLALDYREAGRIVVTASADAPRAVAAGLFQRLGKAVTPVADVPGMVVTRTLAMIANEAAELVSHAVADVEDIDHALRLGASYPVGPLEWTDSVGTDFVLAVIGNLSDFYREDRYRPAPLLRAMSAARKRFYQDAE